MSLISSGTPNNIRLPNHITHIIQYRHRTLSVRTLRFENYIHMTETPLQSITNSGTWMLILAPTYSTKIFIDRTIMTAYVIPFVCRYVTCPRFDRRYPIPSSISLPVSLFTRSVIHHLVTNFLVICLQAYDEYYREGPEIPLRQSEWQILISKYANPTCPFGDTCRAPL